MKMPSDISEDFKDSWEAFLELPGTRNLDKKVLFDSFRIMLKQAGVKVEVHNSVSDFITVNKRYRVLLKNLHAKQLLAHLRPVKHTFSFQTNSDSLVNTVNGLVVKGVIKLKPQRFSLDYLIQRMVDLKTFSSFPTVLKLDATRKQDKVVYKDRFPATYNRVKPASKINVLLLPNIRVTAARLKGDFLALEYEVFFDEVFPMYPDLEKQLTAIWRRTSIGDFR